jgi:hypothetical protein
VTETKRAGRPHVIYMLSLQRRRLFRLEFQSLRRYVVSGGRFHMYQQLANLAYMITFAVAKARRAVVNAWRSEMADQTGRYQPEAHYMRGPGPKWRAKHAQSSPDDGKTADFSSNCEFRP